MDPIYLWDLPWYNILMKHYRTRKGKITSMYYGMVHRCKLRGHPPVLFSLQEFNTWISNTSFDILYNTWVREGYQQSMSPSIDRLDDDLSYVFSNMQVISVEENISKVHRPNRSWKERKCKPTKTGIIPVNLYDKKIFIRMYESISKACIDTGVSYITIKRHCENRVKSTKRYTWTYYKK